MRSEGAFSECDCDTERIGLTGWNIGRNTTGWLTTVLMVLDMEFCEKSGGTNGDEGRTVGIGPQESGKLGEEVLVEVVGDDEGK